METSRDRPMNSVLAHANVIIGPIVARNHPVVISLVDAWTKVGYNWTGYL